MRFLLSLLIFCTSLSLAKASEISRINTRDGVSVPLIYLKHPQAKANLVLLPGGAGGFGKMQNGEPDGRNFLVRSYRHFVDAGFNVIIMGKPSDINDLDYADRIAPPHQQDIAAVVDMLHQDNVLPVWLIGTSRGTVSATAAAINLSPSKIAGIVLSSSIVSNKKPGAIPFQKLQEISLPVLLVHHRDDACQVCSPSLVPSILERLTSTKDKQLIWMQGGQNPEGDACEALHYHGYIGIEADTVKRITDWIRLHTTNNIERNI
jgi:pimeloyl-ACP methyl ester carboxylesterase